MYYKLLGIIVVLSNLTLFFMEYPIIFIPVFAVVYGASFYVEYKLRKCNGVRGYLHLMRIGSKSKRKSLIAFIMIDLVLSISIFCSFNIYTGYFRYTEQFVETFDGDHFIKNNAWWVPKPFKTILVDAQTLTDEALILYERAMAEEATGEDVEVLRDKVHIAYDRVDKEVRWLFTLSIALIVNDIGKHIYWKLICWRRRNANRGKVAKCS